MYRYTGRGSEGSWPQKLLSPWSLGCATLPACKHSLLCPLGKLSELPFGFFMEGSLSKHNWLNLGHWRLIQSPAPLPSLDVCVGRGTLKVSTLRDFPGGPVAKISHSPCRVPGLIPGQGTGSHMSQLGVLHAVTKDLAWCNEDQRSCMPQLGLSAAK